MDLSLYKNQLNSILKRLDAEIDNQFGKDNESEIDLSKVTGILAEIDKKIINRANIAKGMSGDDKDTRDSIKEMIEEINKDVKSRLDRFVDSISNEDKKNEINGVYKDSVENNETNKTQKEIDSFEKELETGKDSKGNDIDITSYEERYNQIKAKREFAVFFGNKLNKGEMETIASKDSIDEALKTLNKNKEEYEKTAKSLDRLAPDQIKNEVKDLYDMLYVKKGVKEENIKSQLDKVKQIFENDKIKNIIKCNISDKDNDQNKLRTDLINIYTKLDSKKSKEYKEIKDKIEKEKEKNKTEYEKGLKTNVIYQLVGDDIDKFIPADVSIDEIKKADQEFQQWKATTGIETYVNCNAMAMAGYANMYKQQEEKLEKLKNKKEKPKEIDYDAIKSDEDATEIKLSDLNLGNEDSNIVLTARKSSLGRSSGDNKLEFTEDILKPENKDKLEAAKKDLYKEFISHEEATAMIPTGVVKKGNRIVDWFRKLIGRDTKEERTRKEYLMPILENGIKEKITRMQNDIETKKQIEKDAYESRTKDFDDYVALKDEDLKEFNKKVRENIVGGASREDAYQKAQEDRNADYSNIFNNEDKEKE